MTSKQRTYQSDPGRVIDASFEENRDSRTLDYLITIFGFGLCFAWIVFCLSEPIFFEKSHVFQWIYLAVGAGAALTAVFVSKKFKRSIRHVQVNLYRITALLLVLSSIIVPLIVFLHHEVLALAGFIIGGAGAGLLQTLWGEQLTKHEIRFTTIVSPAAAIVSGFFVALSHTDISEEVNFFGYLAFPLVSFGLLLLKADRSNVKIRQFLGRGKPKVEDVEKSTLTDDEDARVKEAKPAATKSIDAQTMKLMFSIMIFSLLCRMFDILLHDYTDPFSFIGDSSLFALVIVGVSFLLLVMLLKDRFNLAFTYRLSLPIMVAGFVLIALFSNTQAALSVLLINIGYDFFDILVWIIFADIAIHRGVHPLRAFGLGVAFMFTGMALGYFAGDMINALILQGDIQITVVAMVCTLSLVIVAFLVIPENVIARVTHAAHPNGRTRPTTISTGAFRGDKGSVAGVGRERNVVDGSGDADRGADLKSKLDRNCVLVAKAYGLTPREKEVLALLAYGRTLNIIARDLTVATGTARSHMEKIYRKLGVHKQQELIDLVENFDS